MSSDCTEENVEHIASDLRQHLLQDIWLAGDPQGVDRLRGLSHPAGHLRMDDLMEVQRRLWRLTEWVMSPAAKLSAPTKKDGSMQYAVALLRQSFTTDGSTFYCRIVEPLMRESNQRMLTGWSSTVAGRAMRGLQCDTLRDFLLQHDDPNHPARLGLQGFMQTVRLAAAVMLGLVRPRQRRMTAREIVREAIYDVLAERGTLRYTTETLLHLRAYLEQEVPEQAEEMFVRSPRRPAGYLDFSSDERGYGELATVGRMLHTLDVVMRAAVSRFG